MLEATPSLTYIDFIVVVVGAVEMVVTPLVEAS